MILQFKTRRPRTHIIIKDGWEVGRIEGEAGQGWEIVERCRYDKTAPIWDAGRHDFPTLKEAKRHLVRKIRDTYPGLEKER